MDPKVRFKDFWIRRDVLHGHQNGRMLCRAFHIFDIVWSELQILPAEIDDDAFVHFYPCTASSICIAPSMTFHKTTNRCLLQRNVVSQYLSKECLGQVYAKGHK